MQVEISKDDPARLNVNSSDHLLGSKRSPSALSANTGREKSDPNQTTKCLDNLVKHLHELGNDKALIGIQTSYNAMQELLESMASL